MTLNAYSFITSSISDGTSDRLDFFDVFSNNSVFNSFEVRLANAVPATNGTTLFMRFSTDGATHSTQSVCSFCTMWNSSNNATPAGDQASAVAYARLINANIWAGTTGSNVMGRMIFFNPASSLNKLVTAKMNIWSTISPASTSGQYTRGIGFDTTSAVTGFQIIGGTASATVGTTNFLSGASVSVFGILS